MTVEQKVIGVLVFIITIGIMIIMLMAEDIKARKADIRIYENQITELKDESLRLAERFEEARQQADADVRKVQNETKRILAAKVPKECNAAIQWGINAARDLS